MGKDSKYGLQQIKFVDKLLYILDINGVTDYNTMVTHKNITDTQIELINGIMDDFKKYFPTKGFNLKRKNYKIDSQMLVISFLKNCLGHIGVNFDTIRVKNISYVRLRGMNKLLYNYINLGMSDIVQKQMEDIIQNTDQYQEDGPKVENDTITASDSLRIFRKITDKKLCFRVDSLDLFLVNGYVHKLSLINLPNKYTYKIFFNEMDGIKSKLIDGYQTFIFNDPKINILRDIINPRTHPFKNQFINFTRFNTVKIDVINDDPYDNFHIYNPITKKFLMDEYIVRTISFNEYGIKKENEVIFHPNHTYKLNQHHLVERVTVDRNGSKMVLCDTILKELLPHGKEYTFDAPDLVPFRDIFHENSSMVIYYRDYASILEKTLEFSRISHVYIISDVKEEAPNSIMCEIVYHNIEQVLYENGVETKDRNWLFV